MKPATVVEAIAAAVSTAKHIIEHRHRYRPSLVALAKRVVAQHG